MLLEMSLTLPNSEKEWYVPGPGATVFLPRLPLADLPNDLTKLDLYLDELYFPVEFRQSRDSSASNNQVHAPGPRLNACFLRLPEPSKSIVLLRIVGDNGLLNSVHFYV